MLAFTVIFAIVAAVLGLSVSKSTHAHVSRSLVVMQERTQVKKLPYYLHHHPPRHFLTHPLEFDRVSLLLPLV